MKNEMFFVITRHPGGKAFLCRNEVGVLVVSFRFGSSRFWHCLGVVLMPVFLWSPNFPVLINLIFEFV